LGVRSGRNSLLSFTVGAGETVVVVVVEGACLR